MAIRPYLRRAGRDLPGCFRPRRTAMEIGVLTLELHLSDANSLKDKRQVIRSLREKLRTRFNCAVAEVDHNDLWQRGTVAVVAISNDHQHLQQMLEGISREAEHILGGDLANSSIEIL